MRAARLLPAVLLAALAAAGLPAPYAAATSPHAPAERPHPLHEPVPYRPTGRLQVRFKNGVSARAQAAAFGRVTARGHRVHVDARIPSLNAAVLSVSSAAAVQELLRDDSAVAYVEPESRYFPMTTEPPTNELIHVGADTVQAGGNTGAGTEIAVVDSPVDRANPDLDSAGKVPVLANYSTSVPNNPDDPFQTRNYACTAALCPHGTAVATVAAAEAGDGNMAGVAPDAKVLSYNVFRRWVRTDPDTHAVTTEISASSADIAAALGALKTYASTHPALVAVNLSLGGTFDNRLARDAIADLHANAPRVTVVVAAGNEGSERASFPAGDPYVLSVGAIGQTPDTVSCPATKPSPSAPWAEVGFSNRGDVDVLAPGRCVTAWWNGAVKNVDGTSFAAPMTAGALALLAAATPATTGDAARAALLAGAAHPDPAPEAGHLDIPGALAKATGSTVYDAMFLDRGGMVAATVGRRSVEILSVDPANTPPPSSPALVIPPGMGSAGAPQDTTRQNVATRRVAYSAPSSGTTFALTAGTATVPVTLLDATDGFEGVPATSGQTNNVALTYGTSSAYVRSAAVPTNARMDYSFRYDSHAQDADVFLWEPANNFETADGASEPVWSGGFDTSTTNHVVVGTRSDPCEYLGGPTDDPNSYRACRSGRYLVGWVLFDDGESSAAGSTYGLTMRFGPTATVTPPLLLSSVLTSPGGFTVSWHGGNGATKYDVLYGLRTKNSDGTWTSPHYTPWLSRVTQTSATFGAYSQPVKLYLGQTYNFLVWAWDNYGNGSPMVSNAAVVPYDDYGANTSYSAGWAGSPAAGRWKGTIHASSLAGASGTFTTDGGQVLVVGDRCAGCGQFRLYVDGAYVTTVDTYASTTQYRQVLYAGPITGIKNARKIRLVVVGTPGRARVGIDGWAARR